MSQLVVPTFSESVPELLTLLKPQAVQNDATDTLTNSAIGDDLHMDSRRTEARKAVEAYRDAMVEVEKGMADFGDHTVYRHIRDSARNAYASLQNLAVEDNSVAPFVDALKLEAGLMLENSHTRHVIQAEQRIAQRSMLHGPKTLEKLTLLDTIDARLRDSSSQSDDETLLKENAVTAIDCYKKALNKVAGPALAKRVGEDALNALNDVTHVDHSFVDLADQLREAVLPKTRMAR